MKTCYQHFTYNTLLLQNAITRVCDNRTSAKQSYCDPELCPFGIAFIQDCVPSGWRRFGIVSIRDPVHSGSCPFGVLSIRDRVHSGLCPFGIESIWAIVQIPLAILSFTTKFNTNFDRFIEHVYNK